MNERSNFRRELASFLEQRHLADATTWLMLPEDATAQEIHERIDERYRWAEEHEFDADYSAEASFLLKWRGFLEQELTQRASEWDDTSQTVVAPRQGTPQNTNLAGVPASATVSAGFRGSVAIPGPRVAATPPPPEGAAPVAAVPPAVGSAAPPARSATSPALGTTPPARNPVPPSLHTASSPLSVPAKSTPWPLYTAIVVGCVLAVAYGGKLLPSAPTEAPPAARPVVATPPAAPPAAPITTAAAPAPTTPAPTTPAPPPATPAPAPTTPAPAPPPAAAPPPATERTTARTRATPAAAPAATPAAPAEPPCIEKGSFGGKLGENTLNLVVTRVAGRGLAATASITGAGDSTATYALVGTCSDHTVRLMSPELTLEGTLSADGGKLDGAGRVGAGEQSWHMARR